MCICTYVYTCTYKYTYIYMYVGVGVGVYDRIRNCTSRNPNILLGLVRKKSDISSGVDILPPHVPRDCNTYIYIQHV